MADWLVDTTRLEFDPSAVGSGGGVTNVTGTIPIFSTGGATPDISLQTPLDVSYGGTGDATFVTPGYLKTPGGVNPFTSQGVPIPIADGGTNRTTTPADTAIVNVQAGAYTGDANNLVFDDATKRIGVGLGASAPTAPLDVKTETAVGSGVRIRAGGFGLAGLDFSSSDGATPWGLLSSDATAMHVSPPGGASGRTSFLGLIDGQSLTLSDKVATTAVGLTLLGGTNSDIALPNGTYFHVTGPGGPFDLGGFTSPANGRRILVYNGTFNTMTILNEDPLSTATNRIKTLSSADVTLGPGFESIVEFIYDTTDQRWIMIGASETPGFLKADGSIPLTNDWIAGPYKIYSANSVNVYNVVTGYGADSGGVVPADTAINAAITAANLNGGGVVYLPRGTYNIATGLTLLQNVTLQGESMLSTTLKTSGAVDILAIDGTTYPGNDTSVYINDLHLDNNGVGTRGAVIHNAVFTEFNRVWFSGALTEGVLVTNNGGMATFHNQFNQCFIGGPIAVHATGDFITGLVLIDCEVIGTSGGMVVDAIKGYNVTSYASIFEGSGGPGVRLEGSATAGADLIFNCTDTYFESNTTADVDINPSAATPAFPAVSIKGGSMVGTTARGIRMNPRCAMLQVTGVTSALHGTADIDLGDLSTTTAYINIQGNNLLSATKVLSTNPAVTSRSIIVGAVQPVLEVPQISGQSRTMLFTSSTTANTHFGLDTNNQGFAGSTNSTAFNLKTNNVNRLTADTAGGVYLSDATTTATAVKVGGAVFTQTADSTTTANNLTTIFGTGVGSLTLPANILIAGRTIRIQAGGFISVADGGAGTKTLTIKLGGVTVATGTSGATIQTLANQEWICDCFITCRTAGAGGTVYGGGRWYTQIAANGGSSGVFAAATATAAANTTGTLAVDVQFNNGNGTGTITTTFAIVEILN